MWGKAYRSYRKSEKEKEKEKGPASQEKSHVVPNDSVIAKSVVSVIPKVKVLTTYVLGFFDEKKNKRACVRIERKKEKIYGLLKW